jgi:hypothetical protein
MAAEAKVILNYRLWVLSEPVTMTSTLRGIGTEWKVLCVYVLAYLSSNSFEKLPFKNTLQ